MSRDDRYRCEACLQFMDLDADDLMPLHVDADGERMCSGSGTCDYERSKDCGCSWTRMPPCSACEHNYVDLGDDAPEEAACEHVKAAARCGIYCPLLVRGDCPTPEAIMQLAPAAEALGSIRLQLECEPTRAVALRPAEARALLTALARLREECATLRAQLDAARRALEAAAVAQQQLLDMARVTGIGWAVMDATPLIQAALASPPAPQSGSVGEAARYKAALETIAHDHAQHAHLLGRAAASPPEDVMGRALYGMGSVVLGWAQGIAREALGIEQNEWTEHFAAVRDAAHEPLRAAAAGGEGTQS